MLPLTPRRVAQKANLSFKNKFPYISVINEACDFKFGTQLVLFAKVHQKITPRRKSGRGLGLGELPKILGFADISAKAEASDCKYGEQLGFANGFHKITRRKKGVDLD